MGMAVVNVREVWMLVRHHCMLVLMGVGLLAAPCEFVLVGVFPEV